MKKSQRRRRTIARTTIPTATNVPATLPGECQKSLLSELLDLLTFDGASATTVADEDDVTTMVMVVTRCETCVNCVVALPELSSRVVCVCVNVTTE